MGFLANVASMFSGLYDFFSMFRDFFGCLPLVVQVLIYFTFGSFMFLCLLKMLFKGV